MLNKTEMEKVFCSIFQEYWDDEVCGFGGNGKVLINARTLRVFMRVFGSELVTKSLREWEKSGVVKLLGDPNELEPNDPCVEVKDYN